MVYLFKTFTCKYSSPEFQTLRTEGGSSAGFPERAGVGKRLKRLRRRRTSLNLAFCQWFCTHPVGRFCVPKRLLLLNSEETACVNLFCMLDHAFREFLWHIHNISNNYSSKFGKFPTCSNFPIPGRYVIFSKIFI